MRSHHDGNLGREEIDFDHVDVDKVNEELCLGCYKRGLLIICYTDI